MYKYQKIAPKLLLFRDYFSESKTFRIYNKLDKSQWWHRDKLIDYQNKRLRLLIQHSYRNVPFYHKQFRKLGIYPDDIKTREDLNKLPILEKKDINSNYSSISSKSIRSNRKWMLASSGGTTGETLTYKRDLFELGFKRACSLRGNSFAGLNLGDKYTYLWGNARTISMNHKLSVRLDNFFRRKHVFDAYDMDPYHMEKYKQELMNKNINFVRGYAGAVDVFSEMFTPGEYNLKSVITTGETLTSAMRSRISEKFGCEVFDEYGAEAGAIAHECTEHNGYHISMESAIFEIMKNGERVNSGERGEVFLTSLHNFSMPFIRYRVGDYAIKTDAQCNCGRGLELIDSIDGRTSDIIKTPNGNILTIPGFFRTYRLKEINGLRNFQVVQKKIDEILVRVVTDDNFNENSESILLDMAKEYVNDSSVDVRIEKVSKLLKAASGKIKIVDSRI